MTRDQNDGAWEENPHYPIEDWQYEVANRDTMLGYQDWVAGKIEAYFADMPAENQAAIRSPELLAFLEAWEAWREDGAPPDKPFSRNFGLCYNSLVHDKTDTAREQLEAELIVDDLHPEFPWGSYAYDRALQDGTQHEFRPRVEWVQKKIKELKAGASHTGDSN